MASRADKGMGFTPMTSISKIADPKAHKCSDWVATEKVHGSSFQIYTDNGVKISAGSRRRNLDNADSFIRCNMKELLKKYRDYALKTWHIIHSGDRWEPYRDPATEFQDEDDDDSEDNEEVGDETNTAENNETNNKSEQKTKISNGQSSEMCRVRIYGELYGGGGIQLPVKSAAQKEIIYCDEFRFYVFGLTINKKWVNIYELNDICKEAGFPYYAKPVCEPKSTVDELKEHLTENGFMKSRSALTEKEGDELTHIEGVVMTPMKRPDYRLHAVKFLATEFTDVKMAGFGATKTANFCTKQRYHSVISKLDINERKDTKLVVTMYIEDILKESGMSNTGMQLKEKWAKIVMDWLQEDDYEPDRSLLDAIIGRKPRDNPPQAFKRNEELERKKRELRKLQKEKQDAMDESKDDGEEPMAMGLFDS